MALDSRTSSFHTNKQIVADIYAGKELCRAGWGELQRGGSYDLIREIRMFFEEVMLGLNMGRGVNR